MATAYELETIVTHCTYMWISHLPETMHMNPRAISKTENELVGYLPTYVYTLLAIYQTP